VIPRTLSVFDADHRLELEPDFECQGLSRTGDQPEPPSHPFNYRMASWQRNEPHFARRFNHGQCRGRCELRS
jgi:hypothetical protein